MSDWGVTDKGSHSLLETVSNQIFLKKVSLIPRPPPFFCSSVYYTESKPKNNEKKTKKQGRPGNEAKTSYAW